MQFLYVCMPVCVYVHTHLEYYSTIEKKWHFGICNTMDEPEGCNYISEVSQIEKDKYCVFSHYVESKK